MHFKRFTAGMMIVGLSVAAATAAEKPVRVQIENLAPESGTFLTPVWVAFHDGSFDLYDLDAPASVGLERIAEDGNTGPLSDAFAASGAGGVQGTILADTGIPPLAPGETATMTFSVDAAASSGHYFSFASMVIPSNDAFIANGNPMMFRIFDDQGHFVGGTTIVGGGMVRDAGTEVNTELPEHTAFFGQMMPDTGIDEDGVVHVHPGFNPAGSGGILDDPMFAEADFTEDGYEVARISTYLVADANCDGVINGFDIDPFVLALVDPDGYAAAYPDCDMIATDINGDGATNGFDIDPFVELVTGGPDTMILSLSFDGLEALGEGYVYEGWIIVDGAPISTGRFSVDDAGVPETSEFEVATEDAQAASMFVLTIEPVENDPPEPADTHVLAGAFDGYLADLTIGHPAAIGDDFTGATGGFILATPTSADVEDDYDQGIWFLDPMAGPGPSLNLPVLPAGWVYEGWVVGMDGPVSTGRFTDVSAADSDAGGPAAGPDPAPPFPGQDFIDPPTSLIGYTAVISVEPEPDDSPAPFTLKPLVNMSIEPIMAPTVQDLTNNAESAPTGTAELLMP